MKVDSLRTTLPQAVGALKKFRNAVNVQTQRQTKNVKVEVKRLVDYKA